MNWIEFDFMKLN